MSAKPLTHSQNIQRPAPYLCKPPKRTLNYLGRFVLWVRKAESRPLIFKVLTHALVFFLSLVLIFSAIGLPLFILGHREFVKQNEDVHFRIQFKKFKKIATEHSRHEFILGRTLPLQHLEINLSKKTRQEMKKALDIKENSIKDSDLLLCAAGKYDDYITRFRLTIISR